MEKVVVDGGEIVTMIHRLEQLGAHAHQRRRAPGRQIEAPEELEPPRLGRAMEPGCGRIGGRAHPGRGCGIQLGTVGAEPARQRLEEGDARTRFELAVARENFARERNARGLAAAGEQILAQMGQVGRVLLGDPAPIARTVDQRAPALRDRLQHFTKKRGIHRKVRLCRRIAD